MDFSQWTATVGLLIGAVAIVIGLLIRRQAGYAVLLVGASMVVGPLSPLLKRHVTERVQIVFSLAAIALAGAGAILAIIRVVRLRRGR